MSIFIGVDQSLTCTGYVVKQNDNIVDFGTIKTTAADGDVFARTQIIADKLSEIVNSYNNQKVALEGLSFGQRGSATRDLAGLQFVIITTIRKTTKINNITIAPPTTIKKFATGSGGSKKKKTTKSDMVDSLPEHVLNAFKTKGYKKSSGLYDITDAYWIATYLQQTN